jgi:hypothetical protein
MGSRLKWQLFLLGLREPFDDRIVDAFLHSCQVRCAVQHKVGVTLARHRILPHRRSHCILVLPLDEFQRSLSFGDVPYLSTMKADFVRSFKVDRKIEVRAQLHKV